MASTRQQETAREAVRRAAAKVFMEKGFAETSIQDIADELGRPKASVYYYVSSKEGLLYEILISGMEGLVKRLEDICSYPLSALNRLRLAVRDNMRSSIEELHAPVAVDMHREALSLESEHRDEYLALRKRYQDMIVGLLEEANTMDEAKIDNPKLIAFAILGMTHHFQRWFKPDGDLSLVEVADIWWSFMLGGLEGTGSG